MLTTTHATSIALLLKALTSTMLALPLASPIYKKMAAMPGRCN